MTKRHQKQAPTTRIAVYCRSATGDAESIDKQICSCLKYCQKHFGDHPYEMEIFIDEHHSGIVGWVQVENQGKRRDALARLIAVLDSDEVDVLIVSRLDRLARSATLWAEFAELYLSGDRLRLVSLSENEVLS